MTWEALVASLAASFATNVAQEEPDIACEFGGTRWGLACKVLYSRDADHHIDRLVEGAKQIEKAPCDLGIVVANVTNLIRHDRFMPESKRQSGVYGGLRDPEIAKEMLESALLALADGVNREKTFRRLTQDKAGAPRWKTRDIVLFGQTVVIVQGVATPLSMLYAPQFRFVSGDEQRFLERLNDAVQTATTHVVD